MMGMQLIHEAWKREWEGRRHRDRVLLSQAHAVAFKETELWNGYPAETTAPYGLSKKMLLVQAQAYRQQYGLNAIYLIPVNLYGPRDDFDPETRTSSRAHSQVHQGPRAGDKAVTLWGDGSPTREFLYVEDAAEAVLLAAERYDGPEPVNLGSGTDRDQGPGHRIARLTGYHGAPLDTEKPNGAPRSAVDVSRAEQLFGFRAPTSLDEGLLQTIEWFRRGNATS